MNDRHSTCSAAYYQVLHNSNPAFLRNNWLIDELPRLRAFGGQSIVEVGCGNGRFLESAAPHWQTVVGTDWARSPHIDEVLSAHSNVCFVQQDATAEPLPGRFDIVCSADFLEHLPEPALLPLMRQFAHAGRFNLHKVACYDDGHSHLSIMSPERWLDLWRSVPGGEGMCIVERTFRKGNQEKVVAVLASGA